MGRESREWIRRVGCCLVIAAVGLAGQAARAAGNRRPRRIAIVPLVNLRPNTDTDWIGVGAAETLTTKLGELPDLITVERTRISKIIEERQLQAALSDVAAAVKVGKFAGAERMLIGSYAKLGANVQFNVRVVDVATGMVLNRASVVRPEAKMFDALYALAEAVIESFKKKGVVVDNRPAVIAAPRAEHIVLTEHQAAKLKEWGTTSPAAYKAFSEGYHADEPNEKIRWFTKAIALDGGYVWAYYSRGVAYDDKDDYDRAIRDYDRAIELDPKYAWAYINRGAAYRKKGEYNRAIRDYDRAIELDPKYATAYTNRGVAYRKKGEYNRAIRDYDRAIELDPKYAWAYSSRGVAYAKNRDYDRAIRDYDKAIELDPKEAVAYYYRGSAYDDKGDYDRAIRNFDRAIELDPKYASAYNNRGVVYRKKGDYDRAIRDYSRAIELDPKHPLARRNREMAYEYKKASGQGRLPPGRRSDDLCFIATAAYGSSWEPNVVTLRRFRDQWLLTHAPGRWAVGQYYRLSPPLADAIAARPWARAATRVLLTPVVILAGAILGNPSDICIVLLCLVLLYLRKRRRARRRDPAGLLAAAR